MDDTWYCDLERGHEDDFHGDRKKDGKFSRRWPRAIPHGGNDDMYSYGPANLKND